MKFSTTELFKLNLICLNPIKTVSSHKCPDWGKSFSLNQSGLSLSLTNPRTTERVPCSEGNSIFSTRKFLIIITLFLDILYVPMLPCLSDGATHGRILQGLLTVGLPILHVLLPQSGCIKVGAFVEPINLVIFSTVAGSLFTLKAWNSHTVLWSHDIPCRGLAGGLWLMLWSGLEMQNSERAPF